MKPGEEEMIFIATRVGAASRNEKLLPEFEQGSRSEKEVGFPDRFANFDLVAAENSSIVELFSVPCITCRAKLKVRHVSAIGQILACPRCGGMVQIVAPEGWKPPVEAPPPKRESPTEKGGGSGEACSRSR